MFEKKTPMIAGLVMMFDASREPEEIRKLVEPFTALAKLVAKMPETLEMVTALRKLLEARECVKRAWLMGGPEATPELVEALLKAAAEFKEA